MLNLEKRHVSQPFAREQIKALGIIDVNIVYNGQEKNLPLIVAPGNGIILVVRNWLNELQIEWASLHPQWPPYHVKQVSSVLDKYSELFSGTRAFLSASSVPKRLCSEEI